MSASELNLKRRVEHPKIQSDSYTVTCCLSVPEAVQLAAAKHGTDSDIKISVSGHNLLTGGKMVWYTTRV